MKKNKKPSEKDIMKYEIAKELGLSEKIDKGGWKSLTSRESGRIGGLLKAKLKSQSKS